MKKHRLQHFLIIAVLCCLVLAAVWLGLIMHRNARTDKRLKADYFSVNQIKYGLLSGNNWTWQVNKILAEKIDSFALKGQNRQLMVAQVNDILNRMLDEANEVLHKERNKFSDKVRFALINSVFDVE